MAAHPLSSPDKQPDTEPCNNSGLPEIELPQDNRYNSEFAKQLGDILAPHDFFRRFDRCVIPKQNEDGHTRLEEVTAHEFRTLIERYCAPWKYNEKRKRKKVGRTMSLDTAHSTLSNRDFLAKLRPVQSFNLVRLPASYDGVIRPLPIGYCAVHRAYTATESLPYPEDTTLEAAKTFFDELFQEFPFVGDKQQAKQQAISNVLAAALTLFCARLFKSPILRPGFAYFANSEGAGKTLLLKLAIIPVLGYVPVGTRPKNEDEMRKEIGSAALGGLPVFCLDNVKGHLSSDSLEALITSPIYSFRLLGQNKMLHEAHGLTVFITSNNATFSPDLRRRTFATELFLREVKAEDRQIQRPLDDDAIIKMRPQILGSLWALVSNWFELAQSAPSKPDQTFLSWSKIVDGILTAAGYPASCHSGPDAKQGDRNLLNMQGLISEMNIGRHYPCHELVELARHHRLFEEILGDCNGDPNDEFDEPLFVRHGKNGTDKQDLDRSGRARFSRLLNRFLDRIFTYDDKPVAFRLMTPTARKLYGITYCNSSN